MIPLRYESFRLRLAVLAIFAGTMLLFLRATTGGFVEYDDLDYVTKNLNVLGGLSWAGVRWAFTSSEAANWHPLTWLSHQLDASVWGEKPFGHHLASVLWHAVNAALTLIVLRRLTGAFWPSVFAAGLWAWHPLRVESVAWVAERKDVLGGFFWLLTVWLYLGYVERRRGAGASPGGRVRHGIGGARGWYLMTLGSFALGLMCKPMLVTLPCVLLLLDYWPLRRVPDFEFRTSNAWRLAFEKGPFFLLTAVSCAVTYLVQRHGETVMTLQQFPLNLRIENALIACERYLGKTLWPSNLAILYPLPDHLSWAMAATAIGLLGAISWLIWRTRRQYPYLLVGWLWFLGTLVPVIGIVQVGGAAMADRYTYMPMIGLHLALAGALAAGGARRRRFAFPAIAAGIAGLIACSVATWQRQGEWRDTRTLFEQALRVTERNTVAHDKIGAYDLNAGRIDVAIAHFRAVLGYSPWYSLSHNNLGKAMAMKGDYAQAVLHFREALRLNPRLWEARNNLGAALYELGEIDAAIAEYRRVLDIRPQDPVVLCGLARALTKRGQPAEAVALLEPLVRRFPEMVKERNHLAEALIESGKVDAALDQFRYVVAHAPNDGIGQLGYGAALAKKGRLAEATGFIETGLRLCPNVATGHGNLGNIHVLAGRREQAAECYRRAAELEPTQSRWWANLGAALASIGRMVEAAAALERAAVLEPKNPDTHANLGAVLTRLNRRADAIEHFRAALALRPDNPQVRAMLERLIAQGGGAPE